MPNRCGWVKLTNPVYVDYHDKEWGRPLHGDQALFELLSLESYQSGLSWETVLKKRQAFNHVFYDYKIDKVASMTDEELEAILQNPAVIRHRQKIYATRTNARAIQKLQEKYESFDSFIWSFVDGQPLVNQVDNYQMLASQTELSKQISKQLKSLGFSFVGPVTVYSFMQAAGLVNDHEDTCEWK